MGFGSRLQRECIEEYFDDITNVRYEKANSRSCKTL